MGFPTRANPYTAHARPANANGASTDPRERLQAVPELEAFALREHGPAGTARLALDRRGQFEMARHRPAPNQPLFSTYFRDFGATTVAFGQVTMRRINDAVRRVLRSSSWPGCSVIPISVATRAWRRGADAGDPRRPAPGSAIDGPAQRPERGASAEPEHANIAVVGPLASHQLAPDVRRPVTTSPGHGGGGDGIRIADPTRRQPLRPGDDVHRDLQLGIASCMTRGRIRGRRRCGQGRGRRRPVVRGLGEPAGTAARRTPARHRAAGPAASARPAIASHRQAVCVVLMNGRPLTLG